MSEIGEALIGVHLGFQTCKVIIGPTLDSSLKFATSLLLELAKKLWLFLEFARAKPSLIMLMSFY